MASYAENTVYLKIDSTEIDAYFKSVTLDASNSAVDVTAGSGIDWTQRAPGLNDMSISIDLAYDVTNVSTYVQKLAPGQSVTIEYGPEDNVSGKPRHVQDFVLTGVSHQVSVDKSAVVFSLTGDGNGAPSVNMFTGGVYS